MNAIEFLRKLETEYADKGSPVRGDPFVLCGIQSIREGTNMSASLSTSQQGFIRDYICDVGSFGGTEERKRTVLQLATLINTCRE